MRHWFRVGIALVALFTVAHAQSQLPVGAPAEVGLSKDRLDRIRTAMEREIAANRLAGGVGLSPARQGSVPSRHPQGRQGIRQADAEGRNLSNLLDDQGRDRRGRHDACIKEGRFSLSDPVARYLPEWAT